MPGVVISPASTTIPVVIRVSQATREFGSIVNAASSTASEIWSAILSGWPSVTDSEVNRYSMLSSCVTQITADRGSSFYHRGQLRPGDIGGEVAQSAVRINNQLIGWECFQRLSDTLGDEFRGFDLLGLDIHHAEPERAVPTELMDQMQVLVTFAAELEDELVHVRIKHGREQEVVMSFPGRPSVAVAITDMQPPGDVDALGHDVDRLHRYPHVLGIAGQERLIDL